MSRTTNPLALYLASALFGFSVGNVITLPALIIQREYPAAAFGMLSALVVAIIQVTYAFGPGLLGLLRDATGSYAAPLVLCMALEPCGRRRCAVADWARTRGSTCEEENPIGGAH
jgi:cyanate permease